MAFSASKSESHTAQAGFKTLFRRLRAHFRPEKLQAKGEGLALEHLRGIDILVFGGPQELFTRAELTALASYVKEGGSLVVLGAEGGENSLGTNINQVLEEFGISINSDCVVRTVHSGQYFHPKEALITDGILNRNILDVVGVKKKEKGLGDFNANILTPPRRGKKVDLHDGTGLDFVYPYGATLTVQKPAVSILSSGKIAYPMHRPVGAVWEGAGGAGKVAVLGSCNVFDDKWLEKEDNVKVMEFLFEFMTKDSNAKLYELDAEEPDVNEYQHLPDTCSLAERVKSCLQDVGEEIPADVTSLVDQGLYKMDMSGIPNAIALYKKLNVKKSPLTLIPPQFETPLPPLQPAVFPPAIQELPPPALDLFDLDEHFSGPHARLAHLCNKCIEGTEDDINFFVVEAAKVVGIREKPDGLPNPRAVLAEALKRIVELKMPGGQGGGAQSAYGMGAYGMEGLGEAPDGMVPMGGGGPESMML